MLTIIFGDESRMFFSQSKVTHATTEKLNSLELLARPIFEDSSKFEPSRKILSFLQKDVFCDLLCKFTVY